MRKKFLSAFLLGALALGATSTIVSCKDYDGDISELRTDINGLDATLKSELQSIKDQLSAQKSELETKIASAQATLQAAIDQKADKTTVADLAATVTNLQTALSAVDTRLGVVERAIEDINKTLDGKADKSEVEALKIEIAALQSALTGEGGTLQQALADLKGMDTQLAADIVAEANARAQAIIGLEDADKEIIEDLKEVSDKLTEFMKTQDEFNTAVMTEISNITEYITNLPLQLQILNDAKEDFETRIKALESMLANYNDVVADLRAAGVKIDALRTDVDKCIADIAINAGNIEANSEAINALSQRVTDEVNTLNNTINTKIAETEEAISQNINIVQNLFSKRLTSILFVPTTYVDGVEAINFASLGYTAWGKNAEDLLADAAPKDGKEFSIDNGTTTVKYRLNPSSVTFESIKNGIKGLSFISNEATNITRADAAKPELSIKSGEIVNGELELTLAKKNNVVINISNSKFTIVSLKAALADTVLSKEEKGREINVYSDWARLTETTSKPLIYNKMNVKDGKINKEGTSYEQRLYSFGEIYTQYNASEKNGLQALHYSLYGADDRKNMMKEYCAYDSVFNVAKYAAVCDANGDSIDYKAFGLDFEYSLMDCYNVLNEGSTTDATNQCLYATIKDSLVTSAAPGVSGISRTAIGKSPIIQIRLIDKNNVDEEGNAAVVDVRYLMLMWTEKDVDPITLKTIEAKNIWHCGYVYDCTMGEKELNQLAAQLNLESAHEFSALYSVNADLVDEEGNVIGTVRKKANGGTTGQIDNIVATFDALKLDESLYNGNDKTVLGFIIIESKYDGKKVKQPIKLTVSFDASARQLKMNPDYKKDSEVWGNGGTSILVIPTRDGVQYPSNSCIIKYRLLDAFLKNGAVAQYAYDLVKGTEEDDFTAKLIIANAPSGFTVNATGTQILKDGKKAAELSDRGMIEVDETNGKGLVGKTIRIQLVGTICNYDVVLDSFEVTFGEPLSLTWKTLELTMSPVREATAALRWNRMITIAETYGTKRTLIDYVEETNKQVWNANLITWYGVKGAEVDVTKATVNGLPIANWTDSNNNPLYSLTCTTVYNSSNANGRFQFTFYNGGSLDKQLVIKVPVTVTSKWQTWGEKEITINVNEKEAEEPSTDEPEAEL